MHRAGVLPPQRYGDVPPNQTLYVNNLNEKIKLPTLKCCIMELFSAFGEVICIEAACSNTKRGQAFVVFRDISCATNALRALQGFVFLDKPLRIQYSKNKSDVIAHEDGTFKPRLRGASTAEREPEKKKALVPPAKGSSKGGTNPSLLAARSSSGVGMKVSPGTGSGSQSQSPAEAQPSNVLFVENLPPEVTEMMLTMLFRQYPGFQEARLIKGRNVAFIEYTNELQAGIAKHGLQGFMVTPEMALKIAFAMQ